jgi:hypothetical protein
MLRQWRITDKRRSLERSTAFRPCPTLPEDWRALAIVQETLCQPIKTPSSPTRRPSFRRSSPPVPPTGPPPDAPLRRPVHPLHPGHHPQPDRREAPDGFLRALPLRPLAQRSPVVAELAARHGDGVPGGGAERPRRDPRVPAAPLLAAARLHRHRPRPRRERQRRDHGAQAVVGRGRRLGGRRQGRHVGGRRAPRRPPPVRAGGPVPAVPRGQPRGVLRRRSADRAAGPARTCTTTTSRPTTSCSRRRSGTRSRPTGCSRPTTSGACASSCARTWTEAAGSTSCRASRRTASGPARS